jgi:alpha-ketoglutarate-dependent taurine dioxygenase
MTFFEEFDAASEKNLSTIFKNTKVVKIKSNLINQKEIDSYYRKLATSIGIPLIYEEDPLSGEIIQNKWTEIKYVKEKSTDTYKHSSKSQPLHTDYGYFSFELPVSFFYCVTQAKFGGATTFVDVNRIVELLEEIDPELMTQLQNTLVQFGRNGSALASRKDKILTQDGEGWRINWNYYRAKDDSPNLQIINRFKDFLEDNIEKSGELLEIKLQSGEAVFFHDCKVLHGRNSFVGSRHLNKGAIVYELPEILKNNTT